MIPLPKNICVGGYSGANKDLSRKRSAKMIDGTEKPKICKTQSAIQRISLKVWTRLIMCNLHVNGEFKQRRFEQHMLTLIELLFSCTVVLGEFSGELFL